MSEEPQMVPTRLNDSVPGPNGRTWMARKSIPKYNKLIDYLKRKTLRDGRTISVNMWTAAKRCNIAPTTVISWTHTGVLPVRNTADNNSHPVWEWVGGLPEHISLSPMSDPQKVGPKLSVEQTPDEQVVNSRNPFAASLAVMLQKKTRLEAELDKTNQVIEVLREQIADRSFMEGL